MSLVEINKEYEAIIFSNVTNHRKSIQLANLMSRMEGTFEIPLVRNEIWERKNRKVIALYRKISRSRVF